MENVETKDVQQRLDELNQLLKLDYISGKEFRVARVNILKECGIDITSSPPEELFEDAREEQEPKGHGCGCFVFVLLLALAIAVGAVLALPDWPDHLGGAYVRAARERATDFWERHVSPPAVPAPETSKARPVSLDAAVPEAAPESQPSAPAMVQELPVSLDARLPDPLGEEGMLPSPDVEPPVLGEPAEDGVTFIEIRPSSSDALESFALAPFGTITSRAAKIRSAPDTSKSDNVVFWGRQGDRLRLLEEGVDAAGDRWYRVRHERGNREGWISASLVKREER